MSSLDFDFAMRCAGRELFGHMMADVAATVFRQVGCTERDVIQLVGQLAVIAAPDPETEYDVRFGSHAGTFEVVVLAHGRELWRATRHIPQ